MRKAPIVVGSAAVAILVAAAGLGTAGALSASGAQAAAGPDGSAAASPLTIVTNGSIGSSWSYNLFNSSFLIEAEDFSLLPLAIQSPKSLTSFVPELATSWKLGNGTLTVTLRRGVSWQQGGTVTSTDVVDSALLSGVSGTGLWDYIDGVSAPGPGTVVFDLAPGANAVQAEDEVLGGNTFFVVPDAEYGKYVTPGLAKTVEAYWAVARTNANGAGGTAAGKAVAADYTRLSQFNPPSLDGDGPYTLASVTTFEAEFKKYDGFYGASQIHVPEILYQDTTTSSNAGEMLEGQADYSWTGQSSDIFDGEKARGVKIYLPPNYRTYALYFQSQKYPLNLVQVRRALAYILHRPDILNYMVGGYGGTFATYPDILDDVVQDQYLTAKQIDALNPYAYNPAEAARLLESAGFTKKGGEWYEPNGKQFTLTVAVPAGYSLESFDGTLAYWLDSFGIKTNADSVEQPGYWTYEQQGNFDLDWSLSGNDLNPLQEISGIVGRSLNFTTSGAYAGDTGIGFGPTETVPGLGRVNVPDTIDSEAATVGPGPTMDRLVWDWARLANEDLPVLTFGSKNLTLQLSTRHYTDWPAQSSPLWALQGLNTSAGITVMLQDGYVRPVS
jgi:peptide/nickel transport system substrate-binding protein